MSEVPLYCSTTRTLLSKHLGTEYKSRSRIWTWVQGWTWVQNVLKPFRLFPPRSTAALHSCPTSPNIWGYSPV